MKKHVLFLIATVLTANYTFAQTAVTKPAGTTFAAANSDPRAWAYYSSGNTFTVRNAAWKTYTNCINWGVPDVMTGVINANNSGAAGASCSGLSSLTYDATASDLPNGKVVLTGSTYYQYFTGYSFNGNTYNVRLTLYVKDTIGNPIAFIHTGSVSLMRITKNFKITAILETLNGSWTPSIPLFDAFHPPGNTSICTSLNLDRFYETTTTATATNTGPFCTGANITLQSSGGSTYSWTGPSYTSASQNPTPFSSSGFSSGARFRVTATSALGCPDTAATVVILNNGTAEINLKGNGVNIADGNVTPTIANNADFGGSANNAPTSPHSFTIENTGSTNLTVTGISITGTNNSMFTYSGITFPKVIAGGSNSTFNVTFTPTGSSGYKTAIVNIASNDCDEANYDFLVKGKSVTCDSAANIPTVAGTYKSAAATTTGSGWTCYCDTASRLIAALKLGGTGAVINDTAVTMKISPQLTRLYPTGTGFITSENGFVMLERTWDVRATVQPSSAVPVRYFFRQYMVDSINNKLINSTFAPMPNNDSMYFYKVTNPALGAHPAIASIGRFDMKLIKGGKGYSSDSTWIPGTSGPNLYSEFQVYTFSGGGGGGGAGGFSPLPVDITQIQAIAGNDNIKLLWSTAQEINNSGFTIERKSANNIFNAIGWVEGKGNSSAPSLYTYTDYTAKSGINYTYRLVQKDLDGNTKTSGNVFAMINSASASAINIYPNPVSGEFTLSVSGYDESNYTVEITDCTGYMVSKATINSATININASGFSKGLYLVHLKDAAGNVISTKMLMKM